MLFTLLLKIRLVYVSLTTRETLHRKQPPLFKRVSGRQNTETIETKASTARRRLCRANAENTANAIGRLLRSEVCCFRGSVHPATARIPVSLLSPFFASQPHMRRHCHREKDSIRWRGSFRTLQRSGIATPACARSNFRVQICCEAEFFFKRSFKSGCCVYKEMVTHY